MCLFNGSDCYEKDYKKELIGRSVLVVALVAVGISGTGLLLSYPILTIFGNTPRLVSNAYGASDSVFGDTVSSTNTDNNNDNPKDSGTPTTARTKIREKNKMERKLLLHLHQILLRKLVQTVIILKHPCHHLMIAQHLHGDPKCIHSSGIKSDKSFNPNPININTGDSVTWTNSDNDIHTVTSGSEWDHPLARNLIQAP